MGWICEGLPLPQRARPLLKAGLGTCGGNPEVRGENGPRHSCGAPRFTRWAPGGIDSESRAHRPCLSRYCRYSGIGSSQ